MTRTLLCTMAVLALLAAPAALAEENKTSEEDVEEGEQAWVADCPPDHMCAMDAPAEEEAPQKEAAGNETHDESTYNGDCGGEVCAYPSDGSDGSTCMDGADANETCRDDVHYTMPPEGHDADDDFVQAPEGSESGITSVEDGAAGDAHEKAVPAPALGVGLLAAAGAAALVAARRK